MTLVAVIGPAVAPHSSTAFATVPYSTPTGQFLLGGDTLGRDVLSRVLTGGWLLLLMALVSTAIGVVLGATAGISAAYLRGKTDGLIMRTVDIILAFPALVFTLLLVSISGPSLWLVVLAVGFAHAPAVARVIRAATLDISERDFVRSVELLGVKATKIMRSEILPNLISPLMVETGLRLTYSIVLIAGLNFLGFGQPPPASNWGYMIQENRLGLSSNPWAVVVPAALIALLTIGTNTFSDAIARVTIGVERRPEELALVEDFNSRTTHMSPVDERTSTPSTTAPPIRLAVRDLKIDLVASGADVVSEVSISVRAGQVLGLVGESGSGKTTVALALLGHARRGLVISSGEVNLDGHDILRMKRSELRAARAAKVAYVPQESVGRAEPDTSCRYAVARGAQFPPGGRDGCGCTSG